jgi:hypothetical protein
VCSTTGPVHIRRLSGLACGHRHCSMSFENARYHCLWSFGRFFLGLNWASSCRYLSSVSWTFGPSVALLSFLLTDLSWALPETLEPFHSHSFCSTQRSLVPISVPISGWLVAWESSQDNKPAIFKVYLMCFSPQAMDNCLSLPGTLCLEIHHFINFIHLLFRQEDRFCPSTLDRSRNLIYTKFYV